MVRERERLPLDDFGARIWVRPGYEPWNLRLVRDADGGLIGATHVHLSGGADGDTSAYVAKLAVRPEHRGRRLAPAMLVDAFWLARAHGATRSHLSTDTRAGARGLYERVGMVVASTWVNRSIRLWAEERRRPAGRRQGGRRVASARRPSGRPDRRHTLMRTDPPR